MKKNIVRWKLLFLSAGFILALGIVWCFESFEMTTPSMEPLIVSTASANGGKGDTVIVVRYPKRWIRRGDIVLVQLQHGSSEATFRVVSRVLTGLKFEVQGIHPDSLDSDIVGSLSGDMILGKVAWIYHRSK